MSATTNPIPSHLAVDGSLVGDAVVAHDAAESGDPRAMVMMLGLPATISIGSDSYAARVVKTTAKTITAAYDHSGKQMTFRATKHGWTYRKHHHLAVGFARDYRDPSF